MTSITRQMADFAINLNYEDIPAAELKRQSAFSWTASAVHWLQWTTRTWQPCTALSTSWAGCRKRV
jgi:hypothetical protein